MDAKMGEAVKSDIRTFDFVEALSEKFETSRPRRKGEVTRTRIDIACARTLNKIGFNRVTVKDIATDAQISSAAFYQYYDNKTEAAAKILGQFIFWATALITDTARAARGDLSAELTAGNLAWLRSARANAGLIHCLLQVSDSDNGFASLYRKSNESFIARSADALLRQAGNTSSQADAPAVFRFKVYALSAMMDEVTRSLFVRESPLLKDILRDTGYDDQALAEALAVIWHRTLFGCDPS
ncbi:MAG: TetR/AcrR family transcriptional regulator [Pseudomonadota bacterium]